MKLGYNGYVIGPLWISVYEVHSWNLTRNRPSRRSQDNVLADESK